LEYIKEQNADILCLQEFYTGNDSMGVDNISAIQQAAGYPHVSLCVKNENKRGKWGSVVFSKFPIVATFNHDIDVIGSNLLQQVDIHFNGDTFSLYNIHLRSNRFEKEETMLMNTELSKTWDDSSKKHSKRIYDKVFRSTINRGLEADLVANIIHQNKQDKIVVGDLNDIPGIL
jgi:Endonuclease/Exonuclease/phosphatase family.